MIARARATRLRMPPLRIHRHFLVVAAHVHERQALRAPSDGRDFSSLSPALAQGEGDTLS